MEPFSLKTITILQILKDESKHDLLPSYYREVCYRLREHFNCILQNKTDIYRQNCIIGCRR